MSSSKFAVGIVSADAPPHIGGMGRHVGELIGGLQKEGIDVRLFDRTKRPMLWHFGRHFGFSIRLRPLLDRWIARENISILHLHAGPGGVFLPSRLDVPLVVTVHHTYTQQAALPGEAWKRCIIPFERKTYAAADRLICLSEDTKESLLRDYGIRTENIRVIPGAFDLKPWVNADRDVRDRYSCVFVARPEKRKGYDLLRKAWTIVQKEIPQARLTVVGRNGKISDADLHVVVGSARLVVCPSRFEGFGLAAAEAIAEGTPVVATNVPGLRTVVSKNTGLLVGLEPKDIAEGILKLLRDDILWNQLREGCRKERTRFDRTAAINTHREIYNSLYS